MADFTTTLEFRWTEMNWTFEWHFDWPGTQTEGLERDWQAAWEKSETGHVFQQPALSRIWVQAVALRRDERPVLLVAHDGTHTIYFPFTIRRHRARRLWRRELRALGGELVFDYQDPFVAGPPLRPIEWMEFWSALYKNSKRLDIDRVHLSHIPSYAIAAEADLPKPFNGENGEWAIATVAPVMDLRGLSNLEEILMRVSANHRSKMRRKMRAVASLAPHLRVFSKDDVAGALLMFDGMRPQYDQQYGSQGQPHMFMDELNVDFYRAMIREGLPAGWLHVSMLEIDGNPVSWHIGFLWNQRFYWYKPCYGVDDGKLLPGHLHIVYLLMQGLSEGWEYFDFTVGSERYKFSWATDSPPVYRSVWYSSNLRSRLHHGLHKGAQVIRKSLAKLPPSVARATR